MIAILLIILKWIGIYSLSGLISAFVRMNIYFRGIEHMLQCYLWHPFTREKTLKLILISAKNQSEPSKRISFIKTLIYVNGIILAPLEILELFCAIVVFTFFPPKENKKSDNKEPTE